MAIRYESNNSGGHWWLSDDDWRALEAAGWKVEWKAGDDYADESGRWLGALATSATREGLSEHAAIAEWERVTLQDASAEGCPCCGRPHGFYED